MVRNDVQVVKVGVAQRDLKRIAIGTPAGLDVDGARGRGRVINIASVQTALARPGIAPYTATKGAVGNLTKGMATDWAKHGLQCNAIAPGYFDTPLNAALVADPEFTAWLEKRTPAGRWGKVEELVGTCIFLASDASSFVNGTTIYVDGGRLGLNYTM